MTDTTVLRLTGMGIPPYSARGLTQTLTPIPGAAQQRRSINGVLIDISDPIFRKYRSVVSGNDQQPPAIEGVWPGLVLTVDCIVELGLPGTIVDSTDEGTDDPTFDRPYVPGSVRVDSGFTFYRPRLTMLVTDFQIDRDEYQAQVGWSLSLEEQ